MKRLLQFSLKTLLVAILVVAAFLGGTQWQYRRDEIRYAAVVQDVTNRAEQRRLEEQQAIVNYTTKFLQKAAADAHKAGKKAYTIEARTHARQQEEYWQEQENELRRVLEKKEP